jgi:hypothetical protein
MKRFTYDCDGGGEKNQQQTTRKKEKKQASFNFRWRREIEMFNKQ